MRKIAFDKSKITAYCKVSSEIISDAELRIGLNEMDYLNEELTVQLVAFIHECMSERKTLYIERPRPKFLDWFLRRKYRFEYILEVKDIMLNPPVLPKETVRFYKVINEE